MQLIIISGRSGAGKSISLHILEDLGFYCVDGLPLSLLPAMVNQIWESYTKAAISVDARNLPQDYDRLENTINELKELCPDTEIIYLDCDDTTLLKRFSETRRRHPLTDNATSLQEALVNEELLLQPLAKLADHHINTHGLSTHALRDRIRSYVNKQEKPTMALLFQSFGYKHGLPLESDFIFDVRCLPNPYWEHGLRQYTGLDEAIVNFLEKHQQVQDLLMDTTNFIESWILDFEASNRQYLTISIGCTGGQHRSVYFAEKMAYYFRNLRQNVQVRHTELKTKD